MTDDKKSSTTSKKKSKSSHKDETKQKTSSDDLLASLFNDLESTGKVEDLAELIHGSDKKKPSSKSDKHKSKDKSAHDDEKARSSKTDSKSKSDKHKSKDKLAHDDEKASSSKTDSKSKSDKHKSKDKLAHDDEKASSSKTDSKSDKRKSKDKLTHDDNDESSSKAESKSKSKEKKAKKKKDKSEKSKSKKSGEKSTKDKSKSKKHRSSSINEDKSEKKKSRKRSRSPSKRKLSPPAKRHVSGTLVMRSPLSKRRTADSSSKRRRSLTPPMYRDKWDGYKTKLNWGQRHSRDNQGYLPWERDRWSRERSRSWSPNRYKKRRYSHSPKPKEIDERRIDKKELLALARKNATRLAMEGRLPKGVELGSTLKNKSVRELIDLCEDIQSRELEIADPENVVVNKDDDYESTDFSTVPVRAIKIKLKEGSSKEPKTNLERMIEDNALRKHFPVSYGDNHKGKTDQMTEKWMPVEVETAEPSAEEGVVSSLSKKTVKIPTAYTAYKPMEIKPQPKKEPEPEEFVPFQLPTMPPVPEMLLPPPFPMLPPMSMFSNPYSGYEAPEIISAAFLEPPPPPVLSSFDNPANSLFETSVPEPAPLTVVSNADFIAQAEAFERIRHAEEVFNAAISSQEHPNEQLMEAESSQNVIRDESNDGVPMELERSPRDEGIASPTPPPPDFTLPEGAVLEKPVAPASIGGLVSRRARLVQELTVEPDNHHKRLEIADIDIKLSIWAKLKNESTARFGAAISMSYNVESRPVSNSVWATKDTLRNAPEFKGGIGEHLLKRMGWAPGQGLGRNMDGPVEPLTLDVKADRKGLYSSKDKHPPRREHAATLNGNKNPVSAIMEYCAKKGLPPPLFVPTEEGTSNNRRFGCKAILNNVEYDAATGATNKKAAKAQVALIMCQALGIQ